MHYVSRVSMLSLLCIGIGSAYFHATLAIMGQVLDEITICWALLYGCLGLTDWDGSRVIEDYNLQ